MDICYPHDLFPLCRHQGFVFANTLQTRRCSTSSFRVKLTPERPTKTWKKRKIASVRTGTWIQVRVIILCSQHADVYDEHPCASTPHSSCHRLLRRFVITNTTGPICSRQRNQFIIIHRFFDESRSIAASLTQNMRYTKNPRWKNIFALEIGIDIAFCYCWRLTTVS